MRRFLGALGVILSLVLSACAPGASRPPGGSTAPGPTGTTSPPVPPQSVEIKLRANGATHPNLYTLVAQSASVAWAGGDGLLLHTTNGGADWQVSHRADSPVTDLSFPTTSTGYAVTRNGLLKTTDGGQTWIDGTEPSGQTDCATTPWAPCIQSVEFPTPGTGYAVAAISADVGSHPSAVAPSPDGHRLYVAQGSGTLVTFDQEQNRIAQATRVDGAPYGVAVSPDGQTAYVASENTTAVSLVDLRSGKVTAHITTGRDPCALGLDPAGRQLYVVTNYGHSTLSIIDTADRRVSATVPVGPGACALAVSRDGTRVYVASNTGRSMTAIDTATHKVVGTLSFDQEPSGVAVSPDGRRLYVTSTLDGMLWAVDATTLKIQEHVSVGTLAWGLTISPQGDQLYAVVGGNSLGQVAVVDANSMKVLRQVQVGPSPFHIAISPDGRQLYITGEVNTVSHIDTATWQVTTLTVGGAPIRRDGGKPLPPAGTLFKTTDGATTWQQVGTPGPVQSVCFTTADSGWAARGSTVLHTTDGGATWQTAYQAPLRTPDPDGNQSAADIRCAGSRAWVLILGEGAAMSHAPYIAFATVDNGKTWRPLIQENYTHPGAAGVNAPEGPGSYPGPFAITPDGAPVFGGSSPAANMVGVQILGELQSRPVPGALALAALGFADAQHGWVVAGTTYTTTNQILHTVDGGQTWQLQWPTALQPLRGLAFVDANHGYGLGVPGNLNAVLATTDGGATWQIISTLPGPAARPGPSLLGLAFVSPTHGFAIAVDGALMQTTDSGKAWTAVKGLPTEGVVDAIAFATPAVGCLGLQASTHRLCTTDGGQTWVDAPPDKTPQSVLGDAMALVAEKWTAAAAHLRSEHQQPGVQRGVYVALVASDTAWFSTGTDLLRTADGGQTWTDLLWPEAMRYQSPLLTFITPDRGWLLSPGTSGLYRTDDGGATWSQLSPDCNRFATC